MAKTVIVKLTDDIDGGDADETVSFGLDGRSYTIDLSAKNAAALRADLQRYIDRAQLATRALAATPRAPRASRAEGSGPTLFSQLDVEEKDRFRAWAKMPTARRIADARVQAWISAGKP
jgi:hypothetical protein